MKAISQAEYNRRGAKAAATKLANKLAAQQNTAGTPAKKATAAKLIVKTAAAIKADNEAFNKLKPQQKRLAVAKDVIAQIIAKRYIPRNEGYVNGLDNLASDTDVQELFLNNKLPTCTVCGLGACILSIAHLGDKLEVVDLTRLNKSTDFADEATDKMREVFGKEQAALIETAFEGDAHDTYPWSQSITEDSYYNEEIEGMEDAAKFYDKYENDPTARLMAIMENIVRNKGTFKPEQINQPIKATPAKKVVAPKKAIAKKETAPSKETFVRKSNGCGGFY